MGKLNWCLLIWTNGNKGAECIWLKRIRYGRLLKVDYLFNAQKSEMLSDVALANVEALAGEEWDGDNHCFMDTTFWVCLKYATGVGCYCGL